MVHKIITGKKYYDEKIYVDDIANLDLILKRAKMSDALKNAVIELKDALKRKDYDMAHELSAVKSLIVTKEFSFSPKERKEYAFVENGKYNEKRIGDSLYGYLDALHHKITFNLMREGRKDVIASGAMIIGGTPEGLVIQQKGLPPESKSPTLQRIKYEMEHIRKEAERDWAKREKAHKGG
jgi:hypothetical protein